MKRANLLKDDEGMNSSWNHRDGTVRLVFRDISKLEISRDILELELM